MLSAAVATGGRGWRCLLAAVIVLALTACATPALPPLPPATHAKPPAPGGALAAVEQRWQSAHGDGVSGFLLLGRNVDALAWRLALIDSARHTLDLQYYVWFGDEVGQLLMARVIAAADRGVRVRLLFDDLNTLLHDMTHVELRDAALARLDRHPNLEIRVFNGWHARDLLGRTGEALWEFERLNRRMHNKQMVADNRVAIIGGRNIGDEYFGLFAEFNFHDLDVLGAGPVARQASAVFDRYWNSEWVRGIRLEGGAPAADAPSDAENEALARLLGDSRARRILAGEQSWQTQVDALPGRLKPGRSEVHTDSPSRAPEVRNHMPDAFRALMLSARHEVLITNAYIIPDDVFMADLKALVRRGVSVRILTNSLASHDVPAVNAHYEAWRVPMLQAGVQLHEMRAHPVIQKDIIDTAPVVGGFAGLHTKAMVIDRQRSFIGSMNLDPRSEVINSEMGIVIDSAPLAEALAALMTRDMGGANSWDLALDGDGNVRWTSDVGTLTCQPARSAWQRLQNQLFKLFPSSMY